MITTRIECDGRYCSDFATVEGDWEDGRGYPPQQGWLTVSVVNGDGKHMPTVHFSTWGCLASWADGREE